MKLSELLKLAKPLLDTNQVYAEIVRILPDSKRQTLTFAPREITDGTFDLVLQKRDMVHLYSLSQVLKTTGGEQAVTKDADQSVVAMTGPTATAGEPTVAGNVLTSSALTQGAQSQSSQAQMASTQAASAVMQGGQPAGQGAQSNFGADLGFFLEVVYTQGAVRYVGPYARTPTLKLSSVVTEDQIMQDTNLDYAELTRRNADGSWTYATFSPREVLSGNWDIPLQAQDSVRFFTANYLPEKPDFDRFGDVYVMTGSVKFPGLYAMHGTKQLSQIITQDQLLTTTDIYYGEIQRWVAGGRTEYLTFSPSAVLKGKMDLQILPRDVIRFVAAGQNGMDHDFTRFPDAVLVKGIIKHPGVFAWYKGLTLASIISQDELLIDTETTYAEIRRRNAQSETLLSFSPDSVANGKSDISLEARDVVILYPKYYNRPITVAGEVVEPKVIPYYDGIDLATVLRSVSLNAGATTLKAVITKAAGGSQDVYLEDYLYRQANGKIALAPGDAVSIKKLLPDEHLPIVTVRGRVAHPQALEFTEGMKLSDALSKAGGYTSEAYPKGLVLIRKSAQEAQQKQVDRLIAQLEAVSQAGGAVPTSPDTSLSSVSATLVNMQIDLNVQKSRLGMLKQLYKEGFGRISIDMPPTLAQLAGSAADIRLERDDTIFVPSTPTYVLVSGDVADQAVVAYHDGITVREAISLSGWLNNTADISRSYIIKASGRLVSVQQKGFLFFKGPSILDSKLEPGDTVVVQSKSPNVNQTWSYVKDVVDIAYKVMTTALTTVTLLGL